MMKRDYGDLEGLNCDCLGCLIEARDSGAIDDDILHEMATAPSMPTTRCPSCKGTAYISIYQPDCAHCADCGVYLILDDGVWKPFRQGVSIQREETPMA